MNAKWPLSLLQPPTVYKDTLFLGWAGKDWARGRTPPGTRLRARCAHRRAGMDLRTRSREDIDRQDRHRQCLGQHVGRSRDAACSTSRSVRRARTTTAATGSMRFRSAPRSRRSTSRPARWSGAASSSITTSGTSTPTPRRRWSTSTKDGQTIPALVQTSKQGFLYVLEPQDRRAGLSDRGTAGAAVGRAGRRRRRRPSLTSRCPSRPSPTQWPGVFKLADIAELRLLQPHGRRACATRAASRRRASKGSLIYPGTIGGIEWGGGAVDPASQTYVVNSIQRGADLQADPARRLRQGNVGQAARSRRLLSADRSPLRRPAHNFPQSDGHALLEAALRHAVLLRPEDRQAALERSRSARCRSGASTCPKSWGSVTIGGPVITASGLIFIGASMDWRVRAIDLKTGKVLWKGLVDAPAVALPAIYNTRASNMWCSPPAETRSLVRRLATRPWPSRCPDRSTI